MENNCYILYELKLKNWDWVSRYINHYPAIIYYDKYYSRKYKHDIFQVHEKIRRNRLSIPEKLITIVFDAKPVPNIKIAKEILKGGRTAKVLYESRN